MKLWEMIHQRPANLPLLQRLLALRPQIAHEAQRIYDDWVEEGGICDQIAQEIGGILAANGIDSTEGGQDGDDHAYQIAYDAQSAYVVDVPYSLYEVGGGYSWRKIEGVQITPDDVVINEIPRDWLDLDA